ncbi:MAG: hypothetical protein LBC99_08970 [Spirochaetota bacterium]|jgi:hypothetical protein|nr:hypothetical protein [Spirochaetota bacterium]
MKRTIIMSFALIFCLLAGCGGGDTLKGTWKGADSSAQEAAFAFNGKGGLTFTDGIFFDKAPGTYTITGNTMVITFDGWDSVRSYTFAVEGNTLTMTAPEDEDYAGFALTRQ